MKILLIGSSGYIGGAVSRSLDLAGHAVVPMLRPSSRDGGQRTGHEVRYGDLTDPNSLRVAVAAGIDGVVHVGAPLEDWSADASAVGAMLTALRPGGVFVYLSGTWVLGHSTVGALDESAPVAPARIVAGRHLVERAVLDSTRRGVVIRAGIVHGLGGGIPRMLVEWADADGRGRYVGDDSSPSWATVHVEDLAELVTLAVAGAGAGTVLHGVTEPSVSVKAIAQAADLAAGGTGDARRWPVMEASAELGADFAEALALTQNVVAPAARALGWRPFRPTIVDDLREGSYGR
ncbi:NAD-dependent epimerase/dehydratase family protein [Oryzobacter telluris]|uniref:NAD-dependent epimerase/dehydratase family protein n=1 Tax=Oryzobacter telluris TaxID=3149179 RepID=UPI00370D297E